MYTDSLAGGKKAHGAAVVWSELLTFEPAPFVLAK